MDQFPFRHNSECRKLLVDAAVSRDVLAARPNEALQLAQL